MRENSSSAHQKSTARKKKWLWYILLLLLLLVLIFIIRLSCDLRQKSRSGNLIQPVQDSVVQVPADTVPLMDTVTVADTVPDSVEVADTVTAPPVATPDTSLPVTRVDTVEKDSGDSVAIPDSLEKDTASADDRTGLSQDDACSKDTSELWVYPDPSGGLHYKKVSVVFIANRKAKIQYRFKDDSRWKQYDGTPVIISATTTLFFDAIDSCGKVMELRSEYYEIDEKRKKSPCHPDMEQVKVGSMNFCIDRYEWPNRKGVTPRSYISMYQAMDSCFSVGKRLCTAEEWMVACGGPYSWKYPYGQRYERYGCVTHDTLVHTAGSKPECRNFFGVFDMSGNLLEWTSTKATENRAFTYVMGGFWESGPKSACHDKRYSYYPQNSHNPVGFRCCRDLPESSGASTGSKK